MSFEYKYNYPQIARDSGFKLRQFRDGPLDWRLVGSLEVERILREQQFEQIDAILLYLSEAPLAPALDSNVLDSGISKYFILSQLSIQYLIFCRKFLDETVRTLRESLIEIESENANLKAVYQRHSNEILQLHKKISQMEAINDIVFPCHMCTKNFVSNEALNVHLSKKHPSSTAETQSKESDRTLINTIKLELEIKHLKERLNIAEKDIRETVENKKSPRNIQICTSPQINALTKDVGTQSNLCETKESDCTKGEETNQYEIISQLQKNILNLEAQRTENKESINNITQKLYEITETLQSRSKQDSENLRKFIEETILSKISSKQILQTTSITELRSVLSGSFSELLNLNSEKLNEILSKIEIIYNEKLPYLGSEIQRSRISAKEKSKEKFEIPLLAPVLTSNSKTDLKQIEKESSVCHNPQTCTVTKPLLQSFEAMPSDKTSTDSSHEMLACQYKDIGSPDLTSRKSETSVRIAICPKKITKALEKKIASYGVNLSAKSISSQDAKQILTHLSRNRSALKKAYPRFYATRNKLKNFVNKLSSKEQPDRQSYIKSLSKTTNNETFKQLVAAKIFSYSVNSENEYAENNFKKRLEHILNSPIKRPGTYLINTSKETQKPIPLPRKRVMFYNADEISSVASKLPLQEISNTPVEFREN